MRSSRKASRACSPFWPWFDRATARRTNNRPSGPVISRTTARERTTTSPHSWPPRFPSVKNRLHLDVSPIDAEVARLLSLGATTVDVGQGSTRSWTVTA
ncbi:VOC family protein [Streptomyces sp. SAS_260]|uniref:VOC family protein n=1 Tax=Streptomyces sp. SAS_260 TaxID=3412751 RepID=UPI00403C048B